MVGLFLFLRCLSLFVDIGRSVIDINKGHLSLFVDMGHRVFGVIDMIDQIYDSNYSSTDIYTSTHKI